MITRRTFLKLPFVILFGGDKTGDSSPVEQKGLYFPMCFGHDIPVPSSVQIVSFEGRGIFARLLKLFGLQ